MQDPIARIVDQIRKQGAQAVALRVAKVTGIPDASHVTLDISGATLVARDIDIPAIAVGDRVYALQYHGVLIVAGRLASAV